MDRLLLDYIPPVFQRLLEPIATTEQPEIDALWDACLSALDDQYIISATSYGITCWESILGITPKGSDTLEVRRFRIQTRLNEGLPYTWNKLSQSLSALCGDGQYHMAMTGPYELSVRLALTSKKNLDDAIEMVKRMAPANLVLVVDLLYNQHQQIAAYTHQQLSAYTHTQIRSEVMS